MSQLLLEIPYEVEILKKTAFRIVEDQARSSTRKLVDTPSEHEILERLLEKNKPNIKFYGDEAAFAGLHYLLFTPFRYPPLPRGSRFARKIERNLFYSALDLETAFCEKAYHRLSFLLASEGNIGGKLVDCTVFQIKIITKKGLDLCQMPFLAFRDQISSPISYEVSQALGSKLRNDGVEAFLSYSARSQQNGKNLNVFTPLAFAKNPAIEETFQRFGCYATKSTVEFYSKHNPKGDPVVFNKEYFMVNGVFPSF